jgi:hypothetical protein
VPACATVAIVTYQETIKLPRFPVLNLSEPRRSAGNQTALQRADQIVGQIAQARALEHAAHASQLAANHGAQVKETFWLINGMVVELPLDQVRALAAEPDVQFVEHAEKPIPPPANNSVDVRNLLGTEPYFALKPNSGFIGILDTGVRLTHTLLSHVDLHADCVNGTSNNCFTGANLNPSDDFWNHGTSTASELTANSNLGTPTEDVPINVTGNIQFIDAALWWPESPGLHNDVDLQLVNPNGVVVVSSVSSASIFERARATAGLVDGTWKIRIHAFNVTGSQLVFWAFFQQM